MAFSGIALPGVVSDQVKIFPPFNDAKPPRISRLTPFEVSHKNNWTTGTNGELIAVGGSYSTAFLLTASRDQGITGLDMYRFTPKGFDYNNNPEGTDSIAFGGFIKK